ncbi:MAG: NAD-dependent epimerase/dehydratase family protein [Nitrospinota bacterium]
MKILVTGGGGFLGGAIVRHLWKQGSDVRSFSRKRYLALKKMNIEEFSGDLRDTKAVMRAVKGCDLVFHVSAKSGIWGEYKEYHETNVLGTKNILTACKAYGVKRLVYTSSPSVVFSGKDHEGVDESQPYPDKYLAHYPKTKAIAEKMVIKENGPDFATVILRPHLIWGPGDNHLVPRLIARAGEGKLRKIGKTAKIVDSVFIDNAVQAHVLAAARLAPGSPVAGKTYFISNGEPMPMQELIDSIIASQGFPPVEKYLSPEFAYFAGFALEVLYTILKRIEEPPMTRFLARQLSTHHWFDISAARRDLGYEPLISIREGLERLKENAANLKQKGGIWKSSG